MQNESSYPATAGFKERAGTSQAAANAIESSGRAASLRAKVFDLYLNGMELTADECAERLGEDKLNIRPRCSELFKARSLEKTGQRRVNGSGSACAVYRRKAA